MAAKVDVKTPATKSHFDDIYVEKTPVAFKERIMDERTYVCDTFVRGEFDRLLLPAIRRICAQKEKDGTKLNIVDLCCCFGNTTMALVNGMSSEEIKENWKNDKVCHTLNKKRRFPCSVTGIDISQSALDYTVKAGICDATFAANLNTEDGCKKVMTPLNNGNLLICTAGLVYLTIDTVDKVLSAFADNSDEEGFAIVSFLNPFELEKSDAMKKVLLKHLEFVGSTATRHRTLSPLERGNYPDYGDWALLEIWVLRRRRISIKELTTKEDLTAQAYYDSEDAFQFYNIVWGGDNLHVGIYDDCKTPGSHEKIKVASEKSLAKLASKVAPNAGDKVMDMGSAYGGCARYFASQYKTTVSCVDLSAKENARNRELTKAASLSHLVSCPGERSFTDTGETAESYDFVVSEDSFLHAGKYRAQAIMEAARVLKPGGSLVFTDIMQSDTCNVEEMAPVYKRIQLDDMGSPEKYKKWADHAGLTFVEYEEMKEQLPLHYGTVLEVLKSKQEAGELEGKVSKAYVDKMAKGLQSWVDQAKNGNLSWGYMVFRKDTIQSSPKKQKTSI